VVLLRDNNSSTVEGCVNKMEDVVVSRGVSQSAYSSLLLYMDSMGWHSVRIDHDATSGCVLIVELAGPRHDRVVSVVSVIPVMTTMYNLLQPGGTFTQPIRCHGSGRHRDIDGGKEPDATLSHHQDPSPSLGPLVIEVGDSQGMASLQRKADQWLVRSYIRMVLSVNIAEYENGQVALVFLVYDKQNITPVQGRYTPTMAISFGARMSAATNLSVLEATGLAAGGITVPQSPCNAANIGSYVYQVPDRVLYAGVPSWNQVESNNGLSIDLFHFLSAL
jgi:hypothetical protein